MSAIEMEINENRVVISKLMAKIQTLTEEMRSVTDVPNPIVDQVLHHASTLMGITARNVSDVSSLLTDG